MKKILWLIGMFICLVSTVAAKAYTNQIVKVGVPATRGIAIYDDQKIPQGYIYDYLEEIRRFTGWYYAYVDGTPYELMEMLERGEIDVLGIKYEEGDSLDVEGLSVVDLGNTQGLLLARDTEQIRNTLEEALMYIDENKPLFRETLYRTYFSAKNIDASLTEEEIQYKIIDRVIRVGYIPQWYPYSYESSETHTVVGINVDVLNYLVKNTNLELEYVAVKDLEEAYQKLDNQELEIVIGMLEMGRTTLGSSHRISNTFLEASRRFIANKNMGEDAIRLMPAFFEGCSFLEYIDINTDFTEIRDIVNAINKEATYYTICDAYTTMMLINNNIYDNISIQPSRGSVEYCFIVREDEEVLYKYLNKAINGLQDSTIQGIVFEYLLAAEQTYTLKELIYVYLREIIICTIVCIALIIGGLVSYYKLKLSYQYTLTKNLKSNAEKDFLTGLYNRNTCEIKIGEFIETDLEERDSAMVMIDVDHFKAVNDQLGHVVGDQILQKTADTIREVFGEDIVGRWGGDEFMIFIKIYTRDTIEKAYDLCRRMNMVATNEERSVMVSVSVGITRLSAEEKRQGTLRAFYEEADRALYHVKESGKDGVYIYKK